MTTRYRQEDLLMKLAKAGQLKTNPVQSVISPRIIQDSQRRFDNVVNSRAQQDKEKRMMEERQNVEKESFHLPHVVETETRDGRMKEHLAEEIEKNVGNESNINHSGNLIENPRVVTVDVNNILNAKLQTIIVVLIVILLIIGFIKLIRTQQSIEMILNSEIKNEY